MRPPSETDPQLPVRLSWLLLAGLTLAIALFLTGAVMSAVKPEVSISASSVTGLPAALAALEPGGFFDLGLLVLLATPAARVATLVVAFARRRLWLFSALGLTVLAVLALSAYLGLRGA
jgi:uncharacterized membrane protein